MQRTEAVCQSGLTGFQQRLQNRYENFREFKMWSDTYGLHSRLGYRTASQAWHDNPMVQSSVNPSDYRRVRQNRAGEWVGIDEPAANQNQFTEDIPF